MKFELIDSNISGILSHVSITRQPLSNAPKLIEEASRDPDAANMFMRLFYLFQGTQQDDFSLLMLEKALQLRQVYKIFLPNEATYKKRSKILALFAPGDMRENLPIDYLLENLEFDLEILYLLPHQPVPQKIPDHDLAIVAMGQSTQNKPLLEALELIYDRWPRPILNRPVDILKCEREICSLLLANIKGLIVAENIKIHRSKLSSLKFPFTLRTIDSLAGIDFALIKSLNELEIYLQNKAHQYFFSGRYIDYQSDDGFFRKFRIALISGVPYVCHLAISDDWIVHYQKAGMHLSILKRQEEEAFMRNFQENCADKYAFVFEKIYERIPLDFVVLDCAIDRNGNLIVFEMDNSGWVHDTDPQDIFPYKTQIMQKVFLAFRKLLYSKIN